MFSSAKQLTRLLQDKRKREMFALLQLEHEDLYPKALADTRAERSAKVKAKVNRRRGHFSHELKGHSQSRKEIAEADDPDATREKMVEEYRSNFASPFKAAELGYIDHIILPENTRPRLIKALMMLQGKKDTSPEKKHGNSPL